MKTAKYVGDEIKLLKVSKKTATTAFFFPLLKS